MKKISRLMMAATLMLGMVSMVSCGKDDEKSKEDTYTESASYEVMYGGNKLAAGQVVEHNVSLVERENDDAEVDFIVVNKTDGSLSTVHRVELSEGPSSMNKVPVCYGQCNEVDCPYTSDPYVIEHGPDPLPLQIHLYPSQHSSANTGTYKVTIAESDGMKNPQVFFVKFNW
jgi:hypothetical protein